MPKILIIDDNQTFLDFIRSHVNQRCPELKVLTCRDPVQSLAKIGPDLDLLLIDLEMPGMDGRKLLSFAVNKGLSKNKIIILSGRDADYLHQLFPMGSCLAVLNKNETRQKAVLDMIFDALQQKCKG